MKQKIKVIQDPEEPEFLLDSLGRKRYPHKYKFGIPDEPITKADLEDALKNGHFAHRAHKSYLVITALIGSRKAEALKILKEDIKKDGDSLFVNIPAFKHGQRGGELELPLSWLGMDLVLEQWEKTRKGRRVWRFSSKTAWRIVKRVFPKKSPHHLRWSVLTELRKARDRREVTTDEIKAWSGIRRDSTIEGYGLKTQAGIHRVSEILNKGKDNK